MSVAIKKIAGKNFSVDEYKSAKKIVEVNFFCIEKLIPIWILQVVKKKS